MLGGCVCLLDASNQLNPLLPSSLPTHLWRNVVGCPKLLVEPLAWFAELAGAKVNELQLRILVPASQQNVLRFEVPAGQQQHMQRPIDFFWGGLLQVVWY